MIRRQSVLMSKNVREGYKLTEIIIYCARDKMKLLRTSGKS
jgi:hypothetical protein